MILSTGLFSKVSIKSEEENWSCWNFDNLHLAMFPDRENICTPIAVKETRGTKFTIIRCPKQEKTDGNRRISIDNWNWEKLSEKELNSFQCPRNHI